MWYLNKLSDTRQLDDQIYPRTVTRLKRLDVSIFSILKTELSQNIFCIALYVIYKEQISNAIKSSRIIKILIDIYDMDKKSSFDKAVDDRKQLLSIIQ